MPRDREPVAESARGWIEIRRTECVESAEQLVERCFVPVGATLSTSMLGNAIRPRLGTLSVALLASTPAAARSASSTRSSSHSTSTTRVRPPDR